MSTGCSNPDVLQRADVSVCARYMHALLTCDHDHDRVLLSSAGVCCGTGHCCPAGSICLPPKPGQAQMCASPKAPPCTKPPCEQTSCSCPSACSSSACPNRPKCCPPLPAPAHVAAVASACSCPSHCKTAACPKRPHCCPALPKPCDCPGQCVTRDCPQRPKCCPPLPSKMRYEAALPAHDPLKPHQKKKKAKEPHCLCPTHCHKVACPNRPTCCPALATQVAASPCSCPTKCHSSPCANRPSCCPALSTHKDSTPGKAVYESSQPAVQPQTPATNPVPNANAKAGSCPCAVPAPCAKAPCPLNPPAAPSKCNCAATAAAAAVATGAANKQVLAQVSARQDNELEMHIIRAEMARGGFVAAKLT